MEYLKKIKEIRNIGFLSYWAWMLLVKSGGAKEVRICFGTQVIFFSLFTITQIWDYLGNRALKARRTKNIAQELKLQFDKVRGATTQFIFAYGFRCDWLGNRRIIPFSLMF